MTEAQILRTTVRWWDWEHRFTRDDYRTALNENDAWFEWWLGETTDFEKWMSSLGQRWEQWKDLDTDIVHTRGDGVPPYWMHQVGTLYPKHGSS